jgi:hypothetical protein
MTNVEICETLRRLFAVIVREVEHNPALGKQLADVIAGHGDARPRSPKRARRKGFDASQLHAVNILRLHGEAALLGKLEQVRAVEQLRAVALASGLVLAGSAGRARPSRAQLIRGIIDAAKHYDAQRSAATA